MGDVGLVQSRSPNLVWTLSRLSQTTTQRRSIIQWCHSAHRKAHLLLWGRRTGTCVGPSRAKRARVRRSSSLCRASSGRSCGSSKSDDDGCLLAVVPPVRIELLSCPSGSYSVSTCLHSRLTQLCRSWWHIEM